MRLAHIAEQLGGTLIGDGDIEVTGVAGIREASASDLTFLANPRYQEYLSTTRAAAVLVAPDQLECGRPVIRTPNPYLAYVRAIKLLCGNGVPRAHAGVHPSAVIAPGVKLGQDVSIGPGAVLEEGVQVGDRSVIGAHVHLGQGVSVGAECVLRPSCTVRERCVLGNRVILDSGAVIGSDGFGYVWDGERHLKIPHFGHVVLEDEVEVGSNSSIDRGTTGVTLVGRGTKIDNLVQVAHNVQIGELSLLAAQAGISGSTRLGRRVILAGQVGVTGHLNIGDGAFLAAQSGVARDVPEGGHWFGSPAREQTRAGRELAAVTRLPELLKRVRDLEARLDQLEKKGS